MCCAFTEEEESKNIKRLKKILKSAKINGEDCSITLTDGEKSYAIYFDENNSYHSVFIGFPQSGSMVDLENPENPMTGDLRIKYTPAF